MVAWSTSLAPSTTVPSPPMRSPGGRIINTSPTSSTAVSTTSSAPPLVMRVAVSGGQIEQAAHRVLGAFGGHGLQCAGGGEDDDQQGAVEDWPIAAAPIAAATISRSTSSVLSRRACSPAHPGSQPPVT